MACLVANVGGFRPAYINQKIVIISILYPLAESNERILDSADGSVIDCV